MVLAVVFRPSLEGVDGELDLLRPPLEVVDVVCQPGELPTRGVSSLGWRGLLRRTRLGCGTCAPVNLLIVD
jgi:hypothetical protein